MKPAEQLPEARVAVVVRTKNRPVFLRRALADIAAQTFEDYVVVIVNDAGDPAAVDAAVAAAPEGLHDRTTVLHRSVSAGMEAAANAALRASASEFCAVHDDDDLWEPGFLERTVTFLDAHQETEMVAVRVVIRFEQEIDGQFVETGRAPFWGHLQAITIQDLVAINRIVPIGLLYRRRLHDEVGYYDESLPVVGDWEFNLRVASRHAIELIDEPLAFWCQRPEAVGDAANSVFDMRHLHARFDAQVRAEAIRESLAQGEHLGPYLFQAHLAQELSRHVDQRADRLADEQLRDLTHRLDAIDRQLERLARLVADRTNPLQLARRGFQKVVLRRTPDQ